VNRGWLNAGTYAPVAISGWDGLTTRIDSEGRVTGTCVGTGYAADYVYYYHRPATDDVHGYGPVLMAGSEMIKLLNTRRVRIQGSATQPIMWQERRPGGGMQGDPEPDPNDSSTQPAAVDR
jgi:Glycosyl Hydrolase Family 88